MIWKAHNCIHKYMWYLLIVELPVPSRPVRSLTCPLPVPYLSLTCPVPVPYPSLTHPLPVPYPSLTHLVSLGLSRSHKGTGTDTIFDFSPPTTTTKLFRLLKFPYPSIPCLVHFLMIPISLFKRQELTAHLSSFDLLSLAYPVSQGNCYKT